MEVICSGETKLHLVRLVNLRFHLQRDGDQSGHGLGGLGVYDGGEYIQFPLVVG